MSRAPPQLADSWVLPIVDDLDGALQAAVTALEGFREQDDPFMAWAALTVGLLEMTSASTTPRVNTSARPTSSAAGSATGGSSRVLEHNSRRSLSERVDSMRLERS